MATSASVLNYRSATGNWVPPDALVRHGGFPLPFNVDFFCEPPADIGPLQSAESSLTTGKNPMPMLARAVIAIAAALPGAAVMWTGIAGNGFLPVLIFGLFLIGIGVAVALANTRFKQTCSFVGSAGATRFTISGSRFGVAREEGIRFSDVTELRTGQTRNSTNGFYTGTDYTFTWINAQNQREIAWSVYLLDQADAALKQNGYLQFNVGTSEWVRVGPGYFEFSSKSEIARINRDEIKSVNLAQGRFHIAHKDAGWFSRKGKFSFHYSTMANARLFLLAMDKLMGIRLG